MVLYAVLVTLSLSAFAFFLASKGRKWASSGKQAAFDVRSSVEDDFNLVNHQIFLNRNAVWLSGVVYLLISASLLVSLYLQYSVIFWPLIIFFLVALIIILIACNYQVSKYLAPRKSELEALKKLLEEE